MTPKHKRPKPKYDILWKGMIENVMEDLLLFIDPDIGKELDLGRGFEFLDKELAEMYPEPEKPSNTRIVDKLVKVFLRDGSERWMLLHVEVQGNNDKNFARRMFEYFIRLASKYGHPVAAIAVLTGKVCKEMPTVYEDRCLWMRARYEYKTLCITDYPDEMLKASTNPFAAVIMVAKEGLLKTKGTDEEKDNLLLEQKLLMVRLLKEKMVAFGKKKTEAILSFLNNYVVFKKSETKRKFMTKTDEIFEKKNTMGVIEQWAEIKHQEGREEGREEEKQEFVRSLLAKTEFSPEKIAELVGVPIAFVKKIKKSLSAK
jgi:predicted transposase/invertase (TIGR01784 family)